jgi:hypothetical protein
MHFSPRRKPLNGSTLEPEEIEMSTPQRDERFRVLSSEAERRALDRLAEDHMSSAASVVPRLIVREAKKRGF